MTIRNSIEYNLTNRLFENCKKRFIIDINDNDDVQITSCIESTQDRDCLVELDDGQTPQELKYQVGRGKKNKVQIRNYALSEGENNLRQAIATLFDTQMTTQFERSNGNFINHPSHFNQANLNKRHTRNSVQMTSETDSDTSRPPPKRGRTVYNKNAKQSKVSKQANKAPNKSKPAKRGRSVDHDTTIKRRKLNNQSTTSNKRRPVTRSASRARNVSNAKRAKQTIAKRTQQKKPVKSVNKPSTTERSVPLIQLESTIESSDVVECSSNDNSQPEMSEELIRTAVNQLTDYLLANRGEDPVDTSPLAAEIVDQTSNNPIPDQSVTNQITQTPVEIVTSENLVSNRTPQIESVQCPETSSSDLSNRLNIGYNELEKRLVKMKELNRANEEKAKKLKINKPTLQLKARQQFESSSIYHLSDNLVFIENKIGIKHLITCLTIILIGEIIHFIQSRSTLHYDQLPIGCLLINNVVNSVQITVLAHFAHRFISIMFPNLLNVVGTSARLICYCTLLFLSYGMLRKSITNWLMNNQSSFQLFPTNVVLCSLMMLLYSLIALCLSADGNRFVQKRRINADIIDQVSKEQRSANSRNWLNSIITLLTPYIMIGPIVGSHSCRLYVVPKSVLILSSIIYLFGLYKYVICRFERTNLNQRSKLLVYELKSNLYLISNSSTRVRFLTYFGVLLIITAYNLLVLNLWSLLLELLTLIYLKMKSKSLDRYFNRANRSVYNKYKSNNPWIFIPYIH